MIARYTHLLILLVAIHSTSAFCADESDFFESRTGPLLRKHCQGCHGAKKQEGGLRLDSRVGWQAGGDRGTAIVAGKPKASLLIRAITYKDKGLQMPPAKRLCKSQIDYLIA